MSGAGTEAAVSPGPVALAWSGGKDSALALWVLREELGIEPVALLTTVTEGDGRVSMHRVRGELLRAQAEAAGLPLVEIPIPAACVNEVYEQRMAAPLAAPPLAGATIAFADLYLEEIRAYREQRLTGAGREAIFPLWGRDTSALARQFVAAGFEATLVCVDSGQIDASFAGRRFDQRLLDELPAGADPCGENGEFHTFVHAGPVFAAPVAVAPGETESREGFVFHDLRLAETPMGGAAART